MSKVNHGDKAFKEQADRLLGEGTFRSFKSFKKNESKTAKHKALKKKTNIGSRKKDFTQSGQQGNWMKVHKLDK